MPRSGFEVSERSVRSAGVVEIHPRGMDYYDVWRPVVDRWRPVAGQIETGRGALTHLFRCIDDPVRHCTISHGHCTYKRRHCT